MREGRMEGEVRLQSRNKLRNCSKIQATVRAIGHDSLFKDRREQKQMTTQIIVIAVRAKGTLMQKLANLAAQWVRKIGNRNEKPVLQGH